jgi:hypothetical protein
MIAEIEARMLALGPAALAALVVIRFHDIVVRGVCFDDAMAFGEGYPR